jgi:hypothetical protein
VRGDAVRLLLGLAGLVPLGVAVLLITGNWRRFRGLLRAGIAFFAGLAAATALLPPLVYLRVAPSVPVVLALGLLGIIAGLALERRRDRPEAPPIEAVRLGPSPAAILALPLAFLALRGLAQPFGASDAFTDWTLKAKFLFFAGGTFAPTLEHDLWLYALGGAPSPPVLPSYPIGLPSLEAYLIGAMGEPNFRALHLLFVAFLGGLALTLWGFLRPYVGAIVLTAGLSLVLWMPAARDYALSANADIPLACFWVAAVIVLGAWVSDGSGSTLAFAALLLAATAATKGEGIAFAGLLVGVTFAGLAVARRWHAARGLGLAALFVVATVIPWRLFIGLHHVPARGDLSPARALDNLGQAPRILEKFGELAVSGDYLWALPLATASALLLLLTRRDRWLAVRYLALSGVVILALLLVYMSTERTTFLLRTSAGRLFSTVQLLAAALLPLLLARLLGQAGPTPTTAGRGRDPGGTSRSEAIHDPAAEPAETGTEASDEGMLRTF